MNKLWPFIMILSSICLIFSTPEIYMSEMTSAAKSVVTLCLELMAIYSIWLGLLEIMDKTGLSEKLAKLLSPIIKYLFNVNDPEVVKLIAINLSSNMLGLGNAATPSGIIAMKKMDNKSGKATPSMMMLLIINCTSIQLLPTTVIGLRSTAGSTSPSSIIIPTLIATFLTTLFGIFLAKICEKVGKK